MPNLAALLTVWTLWREFDIVVTVSYLTIKVPVARVLFAHATCSLRCIFQTGRPRFVAALVRFEADSGECCRISWTFLDLAFYCNACHVIRWSATLHRYNFKSFQAFRQSVQMSTPLHPSYKLSSMCILLQSWVTLISGKHNRQHFMGIKPDKWG